jgi:hypothetical protein
MAYYGQSIMGQKKTEIRPHQVLQFLYSINKHEKSSNSSLQFSKEISIEELYVDCAQFTIKSDMASDMANCNPLMSAEPAQCTWRFMGSLIYLASSTTKELNGDAVNSGKLQRQMRETRNSGSPRRASQLRQPVKNLNLADHRAILQADDLCKKSPLLRFLRLARPAVVAVQGQQRKQRGTT